MSVLPFKHIVFDHDGTLVDTSKNPLMPFEGIKETIEWLNDNGAICHIWTARSYNSTLGILKSLEMEKLFSGFSCPPLAPYKPAPEGIAYLFDGEIDPSEVCVIGDSLGDITGAKKFGAFSIGAAWEKSSLDIEEYMLEAGADRVCTSIEKLKEIILKGEK